MMSVAIVMLNVVMLSFTKLNVVSLVSLYWGMMLKKLLWFYFDISAEKG
jgi:hypothetical protein